MDLNKLKLGLATTGTIVLMGLTNQTKAAVAETLSHNQKTSPQIEELADIVDNTAETMSDAFFMDTANKIDTATIKTRFMSPGFLNDTEKKEFNQIRDIARNSYFRNSYEKEILRLYEHSTTDTEAAVLIIAALDPGQKTSLGKRAFGIINKTPLYQKRLKRSIRTINDYIEIEELDKSIEEGKKEIEEGKKEIEEGKKEIEEGKKEIEEGKKEIEEGKKEIEEGKKEIEELDKSIKEGKKEIENQKKLIESLKKLEEIFQNNQSK